MDTSIVAAPFIAVLAAATVLVALVGVVGRFLRRRRDPSGASRHGRRLGILLGSVAGLLGLATAAAGVNSYYSYFPTVATLLGQRAADAATHAQVRRAVTAPRPPTHGLVEQVHIPGPISGFHARSAQIYLPPAWFRTPRPVLPVIELLHGTPGTTNDWTRAGGADLTADHWADAHQGVAPIIVMADENGGFLRDTECTNTRLHGRAETYLTTDVPAWVVAHLGASADRARWAIAGSSEGGYCALALALRHRDRYSVFVDMSGRDRPTYHGGIHHLLGSNRARRNEYMPEWLLAHRGGGPPLAGWFEVGSADHGTTRAVMRMARLSAAHGVEVQLTLVPAAHHSWSLWRRSFQDAFGWTATHLGLGGPQDVANAARSAGSGGSSLSAAPGERRRRPDQPPPEAGPDQGRRHHKG